MRIELSTDESHLLEQVGKQFPQVVDLLDRLRGAELEKMTLGAEEHFRTYKGRVQILTEIRQAVRP
jgi:hypothetical protein